MSLVSFTTKNPKRTNWKTFNVFSVLFDEKKMKLENCRENCPWTCELPLNVEILQGLICENFGNWPITNNWPITARFYFKGSFTKICICEKTLGKSLSKILRCGDMQWNSQLFQYFSAWKERRQWPANFMSRTWRYNLLEA